MRPVRALAVARRILRQFRRDRRTLALVFGVPVLLMTLLMLLMDTTTRVRLGLAGAAPPPLRARLEEAWRRDPAVVPVDLSGWEAEAAVRAGAAEAALAVAGGRLRLVVEGSEPRVTAAALAAVRRALEGEGAALELAYVHGGTDLRLLDYYAPAFVPFFAFFMTFLLTAVSFLRERTQGTLERLLASPLTAGELLAGYLLGFLPFALVQALIIVLFARYGLDIPFRGGLGAVFLVVAVLTAVSVNLGIFLSAFARNELQAAQFIPVVVLPQVLLGDFVFRVADMPAFLRPLSAAMPLTYAARALREVVIRGGGLDRIGGELLALAAFAGVALALSGLTLRRGAGV